MVDIQDIQKVELELLRVIKDVLDSSGIRWYLIYGSCLGCVRHQGFIPWDDDIDIGIMREDYDRARDMLIHHLPEGFTYCDRHTEAEYPYNFGKVRRDNTAFVHASDAHLKIHQGIYIDVFPLDHCPADDVEFAKKIRRIKKYRQLADLSSMSGFKGDKQRPLWQRAVISVAHVLVKRKTAMDRIDQELQNGGNDDWVCSYLGIYGEKERMPVTCFGKGVQMSFEGITCSVPEDYDQYLTRLYGDYMKLPPEEKRVTHHDEFFVSVNSSFQQQ